MRHTVRVTEENSARYPWWTHNESEVDQFINLQCSDSAYYSSKTEVVSFEPEEVLRLTKPEMGDCGRKRQC